MCVVSIVVTCLNHLDVGFSHTRLLGKLVLEEVERNVQVAVEEPADQSEGKHVTTLEHRLHVHT